MMKSFMFKRGRFGGIYVRSVKHYPRLNFQVILSSHDFVTAIGLWVIAIDAWITFRPYADEK